MYFIFLYFKLIEIVPCISSHYFHEYDFFLKIFFSIDLINNHSPFYRDIVKAFNHDDDDDDGDDDDDDDSDYCDYYD